MVRSAHPTRLFKNQPDGDKRSYNFQKTNLNLDPQF
ncbi:MAG: hypothetical protein ACD_20C00022G0014 [uncultured bacterium]|nr:MAG: hypothetical protein ACD_20C00022G0014 [uncultured bacterium]